MILLERVHKPSELLKYHWFLVHLPTQGLSANLFQWPVRHSPWQCWHSPRVLSIFCLFLSCFTMLILPKQSDFLSPSPTTTIYWYWWYLKLYFSFYRFSNHSPMSCRFSNVMSILQCHVERSRDISTHFFYKVYTMWTATRCHLQDRGSWQSAWIPVQPSDTMSDWQYSQTAMLSSSPISWGQITSEP